MIPPRRLIASLVQKVWAFKADLEENRPLAYSGNVNDSLFPLWGFLPLAHLSSDAPGSPSFLPPLTLVLRACTASLLHP